MFAFAELPEDCRGRWESFVDETLRETNRRNTVELVSPSHQIPGRYSTVQKSEAGEKML